MEMTMLQQAETELASLLAKCESVLQNSSLSPGRTTLMTRRVEALRTALELVDQAKATAARSPTVRG